MSLFFYLFTFAINFWHQIFVTADTTAVFVNNQHGIQRRAQDFDKKFVYERVHSKELKGYTAERLTDEFPEQCWTKRGVSGLFRKLQDTGTVDRRPGSSRLRSACAEENTKPLLQKFLQSATDFVLPSVRWSNREHLFIHKENEASGRLREILKQKLSALHASSAVRVCRLLCTAPLETFQMHVLTNNPGQTRPMNTCLPWYLMDSPVGLRLVLLTPD